MMEDVYSNNIDDQQNQQQHKENQDNEQDLLDNNNDDQKQSQQKQSQYHHYKPQLNGPSFLPLLTVKEYELKVKQIKSKLLLSPNSKKKQDILNSKLISKKSDEVIITDIEKSDIYESLGITQFFNGDYSESIDNLQASIQPQYLRLKSKKRICYVKLLVR